MNRACKGNFLCPAPWGPEEGSKGQISFNFNYYLTKSISKVFISNFVCSHKWKIQNISDGIFILSSGSYPRGGTLGRWGCPGGQQFFFKHGHVAYQIDGDDEKNRTQLKFHPRVKLVTLGWGQKVKYHLISAALSNSKIFILKFVCVLTNKW